MDVLHFVDGIPPFKVKYLTLKEGKKKKKTHKLEWNNPITIWFWQTNLLVQG